MDELKALQAELSELIRPQVSTWILWAVFQYTLTRKPIYIDVALIYCHRHNVPITPALGQFVMETAEDRYAKVSGKYVKESYGTPAIVTRASRLWRAMIHMAEAMNKARKLPGGKLTVKGAATVVNPKFPEFKIETLTNHWSAKLTKEQRTILLHDIDSFEDPSDDSVMSAVSSIPERF